MSRSLRGGIKNIEVGDDDEQAIRDLQTLLVKMKKKKIQKPEYKSPLSTMDQRPLPDENNTMKIKGKCPAPFKACDAVAAQKVGKMCPDPRFAVYPYIQEEDTGALCYPNLDAAKIQREIKDEKKAAARHSIMQLIKVLAAFNESEGSPEMCNVIDKMDGTDTKHQAIKKAYCEGLTGPNSNTSLCEFNDKAQCFPSGKPAPSLKSAASSRSAIRSSASASSEVVPDLQRITNKQNTIKLSYGPNDLDFQDENVFEFFKNSTNSIVTTLRDIASAGKTPKLSRVLEELLSYNITTQENFNQTFSKIYPSISTASSASANNNAAEDIAAAMKLMAKQQ
jgi:hypothetical protein